MKSLADQRPPELARQIHPDWRAAPARSPCPTRPRRRGGTRSSPASAARRSRPGCGGRASPTTAPIRAGRCRSWRSNAAEDTCGEPSCSWYWGGALIGAGVGMSWLAFRGTPSSPADELTADSFRLERVYVVTVHIPTPEVEKVLEAVTAVVPLDYGFYDQVAFLDAPGLEQYRPQEGSKGGARQGGSEPDDPGLVLHPARHRGAREGVRRDSPCPLLRGTSHLRPRGVAEPDHGPGREQPESVVESEGPVVALTFPLQQTAASNVASCVSVEGDQQQPTMRIERCVRDSGCFHWLACW